MVGKQGTAPIGQDRKNFDLQSVALSNEYGFQREFDFINWVDNVNWPP